jgi:hypothetical protein
MFKNFFFENGAVYEIMSIYVKEPERPKMTSQYGAYELHAGLGGLYTYVQAQAHASENTQERACAHTYV